MSNIKEINLDDARGDDADLSMYSSILTVEATKKIIKESMKPENQPGYRDFDGESCVDCGDDLNHFRKENNFIRCVECQEKLEHKNKLYA